MKVSLVMAVYNGEEYLEDTINSILAQSYPNLQIIFVNDGSKDSTSEILSNINDKRVKIINLDVNVGVANALNIGISLAEGDWIAIHDADDLSLPNRIDEQVAYLSSNTQLIAVGSFIECIGGKDISASKIAHMKNLEGYKNSIITWEQIKTELLKGCPITHGSLLMSKAAFLKAGRYNPKYKIASDYDFFTRLAAVGPIENVPKVLYKYRISPNSLSNSNVKETSNEFLLASTKYIRNHCFGCKVDKPSVVVFGTKEGCQAFEELVAIEENLKIEAIMFEYKKGDLIKIYKAYIKGGFDGFIILTNAPEESKLLKFLMRKGLKINKEFFTLWSAL